MFIDGKTKSTSSRGLPPHIWIPNFCVTALPAVNFHLTWTARGNASPRVCTRARVRVCELISRECRDWARPLLWMSIIVWMSEASEEGEVGRRMWSSQTPAQRRSSPVSSWSCHCASLLIHPTLRKMDLLLRRPRWGRSSIKDQLGGF